MATANDILRVAAAEIGVTEKGGQNHVKYNIEFYGYDAAYPWCVVFVWWVFKHAGASNLFCGGSKIDSTLGVYNYYSNQGRVYRTPKVGDIVVCYDPTESIPYYHTAIVKSVSGNRFATIDGNSNDKVDTKEDREITSTKVTYYFCRPAYGSSSSGDTGSSGNLSMGSTGEAVRDMQRKLIALGYSCGSAGADGDFGQGTYNAVCAFQRANGLDVDGVIGPATKAAINAAYSGSSSGGSSTATLSIGSYGADVKDMQRKLIALGYSCGSAGADGDFGQGTYNAVCAFQRANGLDVDGIIGPMTRSKINTLYSRL